MISKNRIKQINSLQQKKFRAESGTFVAEGHKVVDELLRSNLKIKEIFATKDWIETHAKKFAGENIQEVTKDEIKKISAMQTAVDVVAEVYMKDDSEDFKLNETQLYLCLDSVRDPGNFGTIIRIANWFGINTIIASDDCVDLYNSKVIQASMGSAFRVDVVYSKLDKILSEANRKKIPVYGTFLSGDNIYTDKLSQNGIIIMGNEGHGILPETEKFITRKILIPCGSTPENAPESLNVSTATAVVCSEFFRRKL